MTDIYLTLNDLITYAAPVLAIISSIVIIIGGLAAVYVWSSWRRFASGKWTIRSITFFPPDAVRNLIKFEIIDWVKAAPGETLPPETLRVRGSEDEEFLPVHGLTRVALRRSIPLPAVLVSFVIVNPSIIPAAVKDVSLTIERLDDGSKYEFAPSHFGKKDDHAEPGIPAGAHFKDYMGSILVEPASCRAHRLIFIPSQYVKRLDSTIAHLEKRLDSARDSGEHNKIFDELMMESQNFLTVGEYKCSLVFELERLYTPIKKLMKNRKKLKRFDLKIDLDETMIEDSWKRNQPVVLSYKHLKDI